MTRVVIIDDELKARNVIEKLLHAVFSSVRVVGTASNIKDGECIVMSELPDLVFVDIKMVDGTGLDLIRSLLGKVSGVLFVVISGYDDFKYAQEAIELGVFRYILKPVSYEDIEQVVIKAEKQLLEDSSLRKPEKYDIITAMEAKSNIKNPIVYKAVELVHKHMSLPCRLSEIAEEMKMSPEYLSRLFHDEMNTTFTNYVRKSKIGRAMMLMQKKNLRICEIAKLVGFENQQYFSAVFKEITGMSAKEYRNGE